MEFVEPPPRSDDFNNYMWKDWFNAISVKSRSIYNCVPQYPTASAPASHPGAMYFDITLNKLRIGGASGWETVTSV